MYCSLTRSQGFPMAIRVSLHQMAVKSCFQFSKSSFLSVKFYAFTDVSTGLVSSRLKSMESRMLGKVETARNFSSFGSQRFDKRSSRGKSRLESKAIREKRSGGNGRSSSWDVSGKKSEKTSGDSIWVKSGEKERFERPNRSAWEKREGRNDLLSYRKSRFRGNGETRNRDDRITEVEEESKKASGNSIWVANDDKPAREQRVNRSSWEGRDDRITEEDDKPSKEQFARVNRSSWERRDDRITEEDDKPSKEQFARVNRSSWERRDDRIPEEDVGIDNEDDGGIVEEEPNDTRWSEIKNKFNRYDVRDQGRDNAAYRSWTKQENWGRKTWQEATESSVPRLVGEVVYGVSPVLAALSVGRREFYALYVQEGLDLSSNNKKKKDKKGFEKVLKISEKLGLDIKETSKHDLNMVADNRPHQGLVLDASPLELVKVKELDPISSEEEKSSLWVALDEVTDPQNLGAIIRSAYFFGATGVVVCAKNSAPLSAVVSKASAGSLEVMELRYCKNMMQFLESSAENGWRVVGGSVSPKAVALNKVSTGSPTILVLGNEGTGLRPLVERSCTELVRISGNMSNGVVATTETDDAEGEGYRSFLAVESLNVSVAAGLFLHHLIGNKASA